MPIFLYHLDGCCVVLSSPFARLADDHESMPIHLGIGVAPAHEMWFEGFSSGNSAECLRLTDVECG